MQILKDRIRREGKVLPGNIIKIDHSSVLEPGVLPSLGSHRVRHD